MSAEGGPETVGFKVGAAVYPLTAATSNSLLADADPALNLLLSYFAAVIAIHLGPRWNAEATKAGLTGLSGKVSTLQVPYDPVLFLQSTQIAQFPLLALYPMNDTPREHTRHWWKVEGAFRLMWVLPPLTAAQFYALYPFLRAFTKVIVDRTEQGYDPAYSGGQLDADDAIMGIDIGRATYGSIPQLDTTLHFPCVAIDVTVTERRMAAPAIGALDGTDNAVQVQPSVGAAVTLIETSTDL